MKIVLSVLIILALSSSIAFAQSSPAGNQTAYNTLLIKLITLLIQQVEVLQKELASVVEQQQRLSVGSSSSEVVVPASVLVPREDVMTEEQEAEKIVAEKQAAEKKRLYELEKSYCFGRGEWLSGICFLYGEGRGVPMAFE